MSTRPGRTRSAGRRIPPRRSTGSWPSSGSRTASGFWISPREPGSSRASWRRLGADVVAVEPVDAMRRRLIETLPEVQALAGTAEAIPLRGRVDGRGHGRAGVPLVRRRCGAGRDPSRAAARKAAWAHLERQGRERRLGASCSAGSSSPTAAARRRSRAGAWKEAFERTELFTPIERARFSFVHETDMATVVARVTSISFIAALAPGARAVVEQVRELLATHPETRGREVFPLRYRTGVYWCERDSRPSAAGPRFTQALPDSKSSSGSTSSAPADEVLLLVVGGRAVHGLADLLGRQRQVDVTALEGFEALFGGRPFRIALAHSPDAIRAGARAPRPSRARTSACPGALRRPAGPCAPRCRRCGRGRRRWRSPRAGHPAG